MKRKLAPALSVLLILAACSSEQPVQPVDSPKITPEASLPLSETGFSQNPQVQRFIRQQAAAGVMGEAQLQQFFAQSVYKGNIINIMNRPGTSRPWYEFRSGNAGAGKINGGRRFHQQYRQVLNQVAREYGVPAEVLVAIVGIETNYGSNMGSFRLADSLPTLAFGYPRRSEFFQQELHEFLLMVKEEGRDPFGFTGSYAGAMGMPQFMPSSYRKWAVDYDGDGQRNIWGSVPDVAASVANYLKAHGWQRGGRMMVPVALTPTPELSALIEEKTTLNKTVGELRQMGVVLLEDVPDHEKAVLFRLETAPGQYEYYIGLNNFYAVWQYNHSRLYVSAVREIANGVGGGKL
ncbi:lytic murein transglycosylase B [Eikenella longinqua]|uniref:Lytic murein transglycosylase B n=1 Tax=Eikenella longinqua TaxID=1795827 RepID=A0A1A9RXA4_9NEIS|nr:lytic murein transglycosylase B [Eikenella longinqua]OAM27586.1 lytic murein transglycosylase B [Eikenella longinqua]